MGVPRLQLVELEDLPWFPAVVRDLATDYLHFMEEAIALHKPVAPLLAQLMLDAATTRVVDLCSGGGGPTASLCRELIALGFDPHIVLTDRYPNLGALQRLTARLPRNITYVSVPVDATEVPADLIGVRTIFNAFHHFSPIDARKVLQSAVTARQPIGIFEISERRLPIMLLILFTPIYVLLVTPFIHPFRWNRLLWTYLLPIVPLTCLWDGIVSQWRAYTSAEMLALTQGLTEHTWQSGQVHIQGKFGHVTWLRGLPKPPVSADSKE